MLRLLRISGAGTSEKVPLYSNHPEAGTIPPDVLAALERAVAPVVQAWERYRPPFHDGDILLIRADVRTVMIGVTDVDPLLGWRDVIGGRIATESMPCDHFTMLHATQADRLAAILARHLRRDAHQVRQEVPSVVITHA